MVDACAQARVRNVVDQLPRVGELARQRAGIDRTSNNLLYQSWQILSHAGQAHPGALAISALVIGAAFAVAHLAPNAPAPLIGVFVAVGAGAALGLHENEIGKLPFEIPPFAGFAWAPSDVVNVLQPFWVWRSSARSIF